MRCRTSVVLPCLALLAGFWAAGGCTPSRPADAQAGAPSSPPSSPPTTAPRVLRASPGPYRGLPMRVVSVGPDSITVRPRFLFQGQSPAAQADQTLVLDPGRTQVFRHVVVTSRRDDAGRVTLNTELRPVGFDEVKADQQVHLGMVEQGVVLDVVILPPPPPRPDRPPRRSTSRPATRPGPAAPPAVPTR